MSDATSGPRRHIDQRAHRLDFTDRILVRCPECSRCALLRSQLERERRVIGTCTSCGWSRVWSRARGGYIVLPAGGPRLAHYELDLFLQTPCCGHILWAWNQDHLAELEAFVSADLRQRRRHPDHGWSNQSLASRLPKWIQSGGNRVAVLAGIQRLQERVLTVGLRSGTPYDPGTWPDHD